MALTINFFIGRLLNRNEKVTTAKLNAMVKGMSADLSGSVGTANIDDGAITPAKVQNGAWWYATAVLGGNTYAATFDPAVTGYPDGLYLAFKAGSANTGAVNLDAGAGAKPITKLGGDALVSGDIVAGQVVTVRYNSTLAAGSWEMVNPPHTSDTRLLVGVINAYGGTVVPAGWLECDGSPISRTTYAGLFAVTGTTYGVGDGATTFNLPDLRGYFVRGRDAGAGVDPDHPRAIGSIQADKIIAHTHDVVIGTDNATDTQQTLAQQGDNTASLTKTTNNQAPAGATETRPKNVALIYIIKF